MNLGRTCSDTVKKTVSALLALICLFTLLCGCSEAEEYVLSYGQYGITEKQYSYWMAYYKTTFLNSFIEYGMVEESSYTEDFWQNDAEGQTLFDLTKQRADDYMKRLVVCMHLYDEYGIGESEDAREELHIAVDKCIAEDITGAGSRSALNNALGKYKLNISALEEIYRIELKKTMVEEYLYGTSGAEKLTSEEKEQYYQATYARVKHVLVNTVDKYVLDDDGKKIVDTSTGYYKTEKLTDSEKAEKNALADTLYQQAQTQDFEKLIEEYNEDEGMTYYTDGYFLTKDSSYEANFLQAALEMKEGEVRRVESAYGVHIIKKYPLQEKAYEKEINENFFSDLEEKALGAKKDDMYGKFDVTGEGCSFEIFKTYALMPDALL